MDNEIIFDETPLSGIDCSFDNYLKRRKLMEQNRMDGNGIPNYAFALDYNCRKKLDSIPQFYETAKNITATRVSRTLHEKNKNCLAVGPRQFSDIYEIVCDCARKLGIGIPNVYIDPTPVINAVAYATDDVEPLIIVNNGALERLSREELRFIIGHECGHIQNYHVTYQYLASLMLGVGADGLLASLGKTATEIMTKGIMALLATWSRAAEVTADRAGMICAENAEICYGVLAKLMHGGRIDTEVEVDLSAIREQLDHTISSIAKYDEIFDEHPAITRRIAALQEFNECEIYYDWRMEQKKAGQVLRSKQETDERCRKYIDLTKNG